VFIIIHLPLHHCSAVKTSDDKKPPIDRGTWVWMRKRIYLVRTRDNFQNRRRREKKSASWTKREKKVLNKTKGFRNDIS